MSWSAGISAGIAAEADGSEAAASVVSASGEPHAARASRSRRGREGRRVDMSVDS
jgi:hypothetical protein